MSHIRRIFVNLPFDGWVELTNNDTIFNEPAYTWMREHNIEEYQFIWLSYQGNGHKVHVSQLQFMN